MKHLYIISIDMDEESVYFTEMTERQATAMRKVLSRQPLKFSVDKIKDAPGFNKYGDLMVDFKDLAK
jgi:hypothetical protein